MPWVITISLDDDKTTDGDAVGSVYGQFTDNDLFLIPFTVDSRFNLKTDFTEIKDKFVSQMNQEMNRRQVTRKYAGAIQDLMNNGK